MFKQKKARKYNIKSKKPLKSKLFTVTYYQKFQFESERWRGEKEVIGIEERYAEDLVSLRVSGQSPLLEGQGCLEG